jgi:hypothetical protein
MILVYLAPALVVAGMIAFAIITWKKDKVP